MRTKILFATALLAAFVMGTVASGFYSRTSDASSAPAVTSTPAANAVAARPRYVAPRTVAVADTTRAPSVQTRRNRSWQREALIIGGSAGAGAAIGAVAGGKKGAAVGAISGGVAGLIYDLATKDKKNLD
jgi:uncharacterized protein YcfJ